MNEDANLGPIAVMGAGAVGCYYGGMLARARHRVALLRRLQQGESVRRAGPRPGKKAVHAPPGMEASTDANAVRGAELVLFCVKSQDTEPAGEALAPYVRRDAAILTL